ncbi:MAG: methionyl-tRNA formyltransferase [Bacteroidota bacterium]
MRIVFFGTPEFAATSLLAIVDAGFEVVCVVTAVDKPAGRGQKISESAVKKAAMDLGIPILLPPNLKSPTFIESLRSYQADLGVVIAFRMLPEVVWSMPAMGTMNLHGSLLPNYRGAAPIHHAIIQGETTTGVTTFFLKYEIDTGDIVSSREIAIGENETVGELHDRMKHIGAQLMVDTLGLISLGKWHTTPQSNLLDIKFAPKLDREFCELSISMCILDFHNKLRGLSPLPGAWMKTPYGELKLIKGRIVAKDTQNANVGFEISNKRLIIHLTDGDYEILTLQPSGKPKMMAKDFLNGLKK